MSRMTSKGQVTIPKKLRDHLGLEPGAEVRFALRENGDVILEKRTRPHPSRFDAIRGTLDLGNVSTDEFMRFLRGDDSEQ